MRPIFQAELVNPRFGDPGLYIDLKFERRALLFDLGDLTQLPTRKLLRISDIFVSHTHVDHFIGFDHWLRVCVGRGAGARIHGPPRIIEQIEHKLHAYTWNLVAGYSTNLQIEVHEWDCAGGLQRARFASRNGFVREMLEASTVTDGILHQEPKFKVRALALDHHGLPSLAFAFEEAVHINVWKNRLEALGLPTGAWLTQLRAGVQDAARDDTPISVHWRTRSGSHEQVFELGYLKQQVLELVPGQRVCYVTDVAGHESNQAALVRFLEGAELVFIEAVFLHADVAQAERRAHLTAQRSGSIARAARVRAAVPFHFSSRYLGRGDELQREFMQAWRPEDASEASDVARAATPDPTRPDAMNSQ